MSKYSKVVPPGRIESPDTGGAVGQGATLMTKGAVVELPLTVQAVVLGAAVQHVQAQGSNRTSRQAGRGQHRQKHVQQQAASIKAAAGVVVQQSGWQAATTKPITQCTDQSVGAPHSDRATGNEWHRHVVENSNAHDI